MRQLIVKYNTDSISDRYAARVKSALEAGEPGAIQADVTTLMEAPDDEFQYDGIILAWPDWDLESALADPELIRRWREITARIRTIVLPSHRGYVNVSAAPINAEIFVNHPMDMGGIRDSTEIANPSKILDRYPFYEDTVYDDAAREELKRSLLGDSADRLAVFSPAREYWGERWRGYDSYYDEQGRSLAIELIDLEYLQRMAEKDPQTKFVVAQDQWDRYDGTQVRREWESMGFTPAQAEEQTLLAVADLNWIIGQADDRIFTALDSLVRDMSPGRGIVWSSLWLALLNSAKAEEMPDGANNAKMTSPAHAFIAMSELKNLSPRLGCRMDLTYKVAREAAAVFVPMTVPNLIKFDNLMERKASSCSEGSSLRDNLANHSGVSFEELIKLWLNYVIRQMV